MHHHTGMYGDHNKINFIIIKLIKSMNEIVVLFCENH